MATFIVEILLSKNCKVFRAGDVSKNFDYAIFLSLTTEKRPEEIIRNHMMKGLLAKKNLFVFNYSQLPVLEISKYLPPNVGIVYVGNLLNAADAPEVAKLIVRWLFSFGPFGEEVAILPDDLSSKKLAPKRKIKKFLVKSNFYIQPQKPSPPKLAPRKVEIRQKTSSIGMVLSICIALVSLIVLSPLIFLIFSAVPLLFAKNTAVNGDLVTAKRLLSVSTFFAETSYEETNFFMKFPVVRQAYRPILLFASIGRDVSLVAGQSFLVADETGKLFTKVFANEGFSPNTYTENIGLELDYIYKKLSFLESDLDTAPKSDQAVVSWIMSKFGNFKIEDIKKAVLEAKGIVGEIPEILGARKSKTYLILLQNNMELRPTGGFIGSFVLVTFERGRITDINVQDVYSADGQLKGHIEPPGPIKKYLGEANWYLRDSNWDPDFPTTATKIEWFLNKEIDKTVDGVIAIDLEVMKSILSEVGPINIPDFNTTVDSQNLYEKTQAAAESDFFPGSRKKANFLTALSRQFIDKAANLKGADRPKVAKAIFTNLAGKHIQIYLHNKTAQTAISTLGWDGGVSTPACDGNCVFDWFGIVEANLGVNKSNYFIKREPHLLSEISNDKVSHTLTIYYQNMASPVLGPSGKYKTYLRILAPGGAVINKFSVGTQGNLEEVPPEELEISGRKEAGTLVEIFPGQKKTVEIKWTLKANLDFKASGEYKFLWRKQGGVGEDPIIVNFKLPPRPGYSFSPNGFLTGTGTFGYNTSLARDFVSRIYWK